MASGANRRVGGKRSLPPQPDSLRVLREVLGPDALAVFSTEPADDEDEASPEHRDSEPSGRGHPEEVAAWIASADQVTV